MGIYVGDGVMKHTLLLSYCCPFENGNRCCDEETGYVGYINLTRRLFSSKSSSILMWCVACAKSR